MWSGFTSKLISPWMIFGLLEIVSLKTSRSGSLISFCQLNLQPFFLVIVFRSAFVSEDISVGKLSPDCTFSMEFVNLSIMKSSPDVCRFGTKRIYEIIRSLAKVVGKLVKVLQGINFTVLQICRWVCWLTRMLIRRTKLSGTTKLFAEHLHCKCAGMSSLFYCHK